MVQRKLLSYILTSEDSLTFFNVFIYYISISSPYLFFKDEDEFMALNVYTQG